MRNIGEITFFLAFVNDLKHGERTISTGRVEILVIVAGSHSGHHLGMCLIFKHLVVSGEGVWDDLNGTWLVRFIHSSKESCSIKHHLDLVQIDALQEAALFTTHAISAYNLMDRLVLPGCEN